MKNKYLKSITYKLTGIELKIHNNYKRTAFGVILEKEKVKNCVIVLSKKYINSLFDNDSYMLTLKDRGYSKKYVYLQALLHEIAHYKQYKKRGYKKWDKEYNNDSDYFENQADRYALRYYNRFIK